MAVVFPERRLHPFEVVSATVEQAERTMRLTVVPKVPVAVCPHCGVVCDEVHQTRDLDVERQHDTTPATPIGIDELSLKKSTGSSSR